ncbi:MAG TPA: hypothetical protein VK537_07590 [Galbitalea sp.]|nr:hypothetical protein [Galbitalea sp.]
MTAVQCTECGRMLGYNAALCRACIDELVEQLLRVPALLYELGITRAGLGRTGAPSAGGRPAEAPLPIRIVGRRLPGESAVQRLETAVIGWARVLAEELGVTPAVGIAYLVQLAQDRRRLPGSTVRSDAAALATPVTAVEQAAVWLAHHRRELAQHEAAPELARDIRGAVGALAAVIWPAERQYLGLCDCVREDGEECGQELRAEVGQAYVDCRRCRWRFDVAQLKAAALANADDRLYKVDDLLRVLTALDEPVSRATLWRWAQQRRMEPRGWQHADDYGVRITDHRIGAGDAQVYRLGDARKLATKDENEGGSAA